MNTADCGHERCENNRECCCVRCCCPECGCMVRTKYIYICRTVYALENRASVCVGDTVFWSNKVVAKKIVERRL